LGNVTRARTIGSRLVLAYMALQVLSGWLIMLAIAWCLLEIWRGPRREGFDQAKLASRR
jgi:hypothetical protein